MFSFSQSLEYSLISCQPNSLPHQQIRHFISFRKELYSLGTFLYYFNASQLQIAGCVLARCFADFLISWFHTISNVDSQEIFDAWHLVFHLPPRSNNTYSSSHKTSGMGIWYLTSMCIEVFVLCFRNLSKCFKGIPFVLI